MKVKELIERLQAIEDKDLDVTHYKGAFYFEIEEVEETEIQFGGCYMKCVNLY